MAEISIIAYGDGVCLNDHDRNPYGNEKYGLCAYCSGSNNWNKSNAVASQIKEWADWDKLEKALETNPIVLDCIKTNKMITWNLWGANPDTPEPIAEGLDSPLERSQAILDFCEEFSKKHNIIHQYFVSTNGFWLNDKRVQDFYTKNPKVHLQLSHDGLGNYVRQGKFDPLYDKEVGPILADFARKGIFDLVNITMTRQNNSLLANIAFINKWRADNGLMNLKNFNVKTNHINDSPYCDHWNFKGKSLNTYINELERLFIMTKYGNIQESPYWKPYTDYFSNQLVRWEPYKGDNGCGMYSIFKNGQDPNDPIKHNSQNYNWSINTLGEYVVCQLIDKPEDVPNPHLVRPAMCEKCEYGWMNECHPCPDNVNNPDCQYKKEYARLMLRMKLMNDLIQVGGQHQCNCSNK